jgi:hypothetical protein
MKYLVSGEELAASDRTRPKNWRGAPAIKRANLKAARAAAGVRVPPGGYTGPRTHRAHLRALPSRGGRLPGGPRERARQPLERPLLHEDTHVHRTMVLLEAARSRV